MFEPGPGSRIKGEIFGGYMTRNTRLRLPDVSTFTYGSALAFLLMPNLTAVLEGRRDAREASLSGGVFAGTPGDGVSVVEIRGLRPHRLGGAAESRARRRRRLYRRTNITARTAATERSPLASLK